MVATICLLIASSITPVNAYAAEKEVDFLTVEVADDSDEDDDVVDNDDGSNALKTPFSTIDLENIKPLSLEEEQALLGNWGDTDAEDGD